MPHDPAGPIRTVGCDYQRRAGGMAGAASALRRAMSSAGTSVSHRPAIRSIRITSPLRNHARPPPAALSGEAQRCRWDAKAAPSWVRFGLRSGLRLAKRRLCHPAGFRKTDPRAIQIREPCQPSFRGRRWQIFALPPRVSGSRMRCCLWPRDARMGSARRFQVRPIPRRAGRLDQGRPCCPSSQPRHGAGHRTDQPDRRQNRSTARPGQSRCRRAI